MTSVEESSFTSSNSSINSTKNVVSSSPSSSISESSFSSPLEADASPPRKKRNWKVLSYYCSGTSKTTVNNLIFIFSGSSICI